MPLAAPYTAPEHRKPLPSRPAFFLGTFTFGQSKKKYLTVTGKTVIQPNPHLIKSHFSNPRVAPKSLESSDRNPSYPVRPIALAEPD